MAKITALQYIKTVLDIGTAREFMEEWNTLTTPDKEEMKEWAREEMTLLGIEH